MAAPIAAKPRSISAQVPGSGTAVTLKLALSNALICGLFVKVAPKIDCPPVAVKLTNLVKFWSPVVGRPRSAAEYTTEPKLVRRVKRLYVSGEPTAKLKKLTGVVKLIVEVFPDVGPAARKVPPKTDSGMSANGWSTVRTCPPEIVATVAPLRVRVPPELVVPGPDKVSKLVPLVLPTMIAALAAELITIAAEPAKARINLFITISPRTPVVTQSRLQL
jgi:hypothetical protein